MLAIDGTDTTVSGINELLIATNTPADLVRIKIGRYLVLSDMPGIYRVEELLPGCRDKDCGFREFRARRIHRDGVSFRSVTYLEKGQSMICWGPYN